MFSDQEEVSNTTMEAINTLRASLSASLDDESHLSPKVLQLVAHLSTYKDEPKFQAILFVEQRSHAVVLVDVLRRTDAISKWTKIESLVGHSRAIWRDDDSKAEKLPFGMAKAKVKAFPPSY
jgi:hypothetical protein